MSAKNALNKPVVRFAPLKRALERSGFSVVVKNEAELLKLTKKAGARPRAGKPRILGLIVPDDLIIAINHALPKEERIKTLLHELIHLEYPKLSERVTEQATVKLFRQLSDSELGYLEFLLA